jgi:hypothetical protein
MPKYIMLEIGISGPREYFGKKYGSYVCPCMHGHVKIYYEGNAI